MKHSVGIFSRSDKADYSWLVTLLSSRDFSDCVQDVRSTIISNRGFQQFIDGASQCSLGLIYHTKNRGRINITDMPESLYDEELDNLNQLLGRDNVIVVIDDVEDSSHEESIRILELQPTIEKLACDLLLISKTEKANTKALMTKLKNLTPFQSTSALQGSSTHRGPDLQPGRHNLEEKLKDTNKTKCKTGYSKPLHGDKSLNTKSTHEILKPWSSNSPEVSFSNEDPQTWNDYDEFKSMRTSSTPISSNEESEMPLCTTQFCHIYYDSQKIPSSIESLETWQTENIYETPDTCILDKPKPQLCKEKSTIWYSFENSGKLPNDECQRDQFCSKTSKIGFDSEILEKLPSKGCPTTRVNNETSKIQNGSENSKKPPIDKFSEIHLYNKPPEIGYKSSESKPNREKSKELCDNSDSLCEGEGLHTPLRNRSPKPLSAHKSVESQPNNAGFSDVIGELKRKHKIKTSPTNTSA